MSECKFNCDKLCGVCSEENVKMYPNLAIHVLESMGYEVTRKN